MKEISVDRLMEKLKKLTKWSLISNFQPHEIEIIVLQINELKNAVEDSHQYFMDKIYEKKKTVQEILEEENINGK